MTGSAYIQRNGSLFVLWAAWLFLIYGIFINAGVVEDAYITFRVVENAVAGYGLRWNIDERVQVYTNPLWMLLHIPFYLFWKNIFYLTLTLSLICTLLALGLTLRAFPKPRLHAAALFILPLAVSISFITYSTSGLENSLSHLLFALFGIAFLGPEKKHQAFYMGLSSSLALVNRLDTLLLYAPAIIYYLFTRREMKITGAYVLGNFPIILWECFSLFYYGFLFPNTAYAKLGTGVGEQQYFIQGLYYLLNLAAMDNIDFGFMVTTVVALPAWACWQAVHYGRCQLNGRVLALSAGIFLYVLYVIAIGGNYAYGRSWTLPLFASVWLTYVSSPALAGQISYALLSACWLAGNMMAPSHARLLKLCPSCFAGHIHLGSVVFLNKALRKKGAKLPTPSKHGPQSVHKTDYVGELGYSAPYEKHIIDVFALCDPLLARLPSKKDYVQKIGHFIRKIPPGYSYALQTGKMDHMDPFLALYYQKLRFIISGDLWNYDRLREIVKFNLGYYDWAKDCYLKSDVCDQAAGSEQDHRPDHTGVDNR